MGFLAVKPFSEALNYQAAVDIHRRQTPKMGPNVKYALQREPCVNM